METGNSSVPTKPLSDLIIISCYKDRLLLPSFIAASAPVSTIEQLFCPEVDNFAAFTFLVGLNDVGIAKRTTSNFKQCRTVVKCL